MNYDQIGLCKAALLARFLGGKTRKMTRAAVDKYLRSEKIARHLTIDDASIPLALGELVSRQILIENGRNAKSYLATDDAHDYFKTLPAFPPLPPVDPKLKSFVLMGMLAAGDRWLLRKEIKGLITPTIGKTLGFTKDAITPLMKLLAREKSVDEQDPGKSGKDDRVSYHITAHGRSELANSEQHPLAMFKLSGQAINELLRAQSGAGHSVIVVEPQTGSDIVKSISAAEQQAGSDEGQASPAVEPHAELDAGGLLPAAELLTKTDVVRPMPTFDSHAELDAGGLLPFDETQAGFGGESPSPAVEPLGEHFPHYSDIVRSAPRTEESAGAQTTDGAAPANAAASLSDDAILDQAKVLLRDRHSHTGLVPICELRQSIKVHFGDLAASHEHLDGRLRRLRREHRVRLVSISDRSQATAEQLSDSVPGEDEMFFYVGELQ